MRIASAVGSSASTRSVGSCSSGNAGRSRRRTVATRPRWRAVSSTTSSSRAASSVIRAPASIARSISSGVFTEPFTEIREGATPARSAPVSSAIPNVSHPRPSLESTLRTAREKLALSEGSTRTGPSGQRCANAAVNRRALRRSWSSETTWIGVPKALASSTASQCSTNSLPSRTVSASSMVRTVAAGAIFSMGLFYTTNIRSVQISTARTQRESSACRARRAASWTSPWRRTFSSRSTGISTIRTPPAWAARRTAGITSAARSARS